MQWAFATSSDKGGGFTHHDGCSQVTFFSNKFFFFRSRFFEHTFLEKIFLEVFFGGESQWSGVVAGYSLFMVAGCWGGRHKGVGVGSTLPRA